MHPKSAETLEGKWTSRPWYHKPSGALGEPPHHRDDLNLRLRRALSWLARAERESEIEDFDAAFIFYWIAFNAVYELREEPNSVSSRHASSQMRHPTPAQTRFAEYFSKIVDADTGETTRGLVQSDLASEIQVLLENKYVSDKYWKRRHGLTENENWKRDLRTKRNTVTSAIKHMGQTSIDATAKANEVLCGLFARLYTLRNQLLHGGATWNSSMNRHQVESGARIMRYLVPHFIDVMIEHPDGWGAPWYPVVREQGPMSGWKRDRDLRPAELQTFDEGLTRT